MSIFKFRERETADRIVGLLKKLKLNIHLMHVCGTHQDTLVRFGLDTLFEECGIQIRQGPGCPVCVTTTREYEEACTLARNGVVVATFGDASRVPGQNMSLLELRAEGNDIRIVYGIEDAVKIAQQTDKNVVFLGVGFETTAPTTAVTLMNNPPKNFSVLSCHRYVPPALDALLGTQGHRLQGMIEPGHVSTIIGVKPYEPLAKRYGIPQVIAGFEPLDLLMAVYMLAKQITRGEARVENEYSRAVQYEGNTRALRALEEVFEPSDTVWRGFSTIPDSGMKIRKRYEEFDAGKTYEDKLRDINIDDSETRSACKCGDVLSGSSDSADCPLFGSVCVPTHPVGPCMVSVEGSCNIEYRYGRRRKQANIS